MLGALDDASVTAVEDGVLFGLLKGATVGRCGLQNSFSRRVEIEELDPAWVSDGGLRLPGRGRFSYAEGAEGLTP